MKYISYHPPLWNINLDMSFRHSLGTEYITPAQRPVAATRHSKDSVEHKLQTDNSTFGYLGTGRALPVMPINPLHVQAIFDTRGFWPLHCTCTRVV
jgi:hypothetical protein